MRPAKKRILYRPDKAEIWLIRAYARALLYHLNHSLPFAVRQAYRNVADSRAHFYTRYVTHKKDGNVSINLLNLGNKESDPYTGTKPVELCRNIAIKHIELDDSGKAIVEVAVGDYRGFVGSFLIFIRKAKEGEGIYKIGGPGLKEITGHSLDKIRRTGSFRENPFYTEDSKEIVRSRDPERLGLDVCKREIRIEWGPMATIAREKEKKKSAGDPTDSSFSPPKKKKSARPWDPTDS